MRVSGLTEAVASGWLSAEVRRLPQAAPYCQVSDPLVPSTPGVGCPWTGGCWCEMEAVTAARAGTTPAPPAARTAARCPVSTAVQVSEARIECARSRPRLGTTAVAAEAISPDSARST